MVEIGGEMAETAEAAEVPIPLARDGGTRGRFMLARLPSSCGAVMLTISDRAVATVAAFAHAVAAALAMAAFAAATALAACKQASLVV